MIDNLGAKELVAFAIERGSALNGYWNLFIAVSGAVLGLLASGKPSLGAVG